MISSGMSWYVGMLLRVQSLSNGLGNLPRSHLFGIFQVPRSVMPSNQQIPPVEFFRGKGWKKATTPSVYCRISMEKKYLKIGFLWCGFPWINVYYQIRVSIWLHDHVRNQFTAYLFGSIGSIRIHGGSPSCHNRTLDVLIISLWYSMSGLSRSKP